MNVSVRYYLVTYGVMMLAYDVESLDALFYIEIKVLNGAIMLGGSRWSCHRIVWYFMACN